MTDSMRVLVTGANGFLGAAVCKDLSENVLVRGSVRFPSLERSSETIQIVGGELSAAFDWSEALNGVSALVHCAARVHVLHEFAVNPLEEFRSVNVEGTLNLARQAAKIGVRRFVFISSIGVNGGETFAKPFSANDIAAPRTPYAVSKYEAELRLHELAEESDMEIVIIRPPLVYGPDAPGNFALLLKLLRSGIPVPLATVSKNRRSFVYLGNLVDLIGVCLVHPDAANKTFLVSDGEDLSTAELLRRMAKFLGTSARLVHCPIALLRMGARVLGREEAVHSVCGSLEIDLTSTNEILGWSPRFDVDTALRLTLSPLRDIHESR